MEPGTFLAFATEHFPLPTGLVTLVCLRKLEAALASHSGNQYSAQEAVCSAVVGFRIQSGQRITLLSLWLREIGVNGDQQVCKHLLVTHLVWSGKIDS